LPEIKRAMCEAASRRSLNREVTLTHCGLCPSVSFLMNEMQMHFCSNARPWTKREKERDGAWMMVELQDQSVWSSPQQILWRGGKKELSGIRYCLEFSMTCT
jgi:hypothetical protein